MHLERHLGRRRGPHVTPNVTRHVTPHVIGLACAVGVVSLTACSGGGDEPGTTQGPDRSAALVDGAGKATPEVRLRSRVTHVAGHLSDVRRERVARDVGATVQAYLDAAFADGERPFHGFVAGLRAQARTDASVLRGSDEAGPTRATASLSVAAPRGRAVGVTARLAVALPSDDRPGPTVTGRLLLTVEEGEWRVFGYDVARGTR